MGHREAGGCQGRPVPAPLAVATALITLLSWAGSTQCAPGALMTVTGWCGSEMVPAELSALARLKVTPGDRRGAHLAARLGHAQGFVLCTSHPKACLLCHCRGKQGRPGGWHGSDPPMQGTGASIPCPHDQGDAKEPGAARADRMAPGMSLHTQALPLSQTRCPAQASIGCSLQR